MIEIGRVCLKIAGRDSGKKCAIVEIVDEKTAIIDGQTRRKKVNVRHLEPTNVKIPIKKGASHSEVAKEFAKLKIEMRETKAKKPKPRPKKIRKQKTKEAKK